jgi:hypothetical protein
VPQQLAEPPVLELVLELELAGPLAQVQVPAEEPELAVLQEQQQEQLQEPVPKQPLYCR